MNSLVSIYVLVFCANWIVIYSYLIWSRARLPLFQQETADLPPLQAPWPKLSIIIPACNEAEHLESALRSLLAQDYPALELVIINDRSTDATREILNRLAMTDARIKAIHITTLPEGWLGKVHALQQGIQQASGDWLLFTDADVHFSSGILRRAMAYLQHHQVDHLALMPSMVLNNFWLAVCVHAFAQLFFLTTRAAEVNQVDSKRFIGVGAFNLVRASVFNSTPGFEWLRLEPGDDAGVGLLLKQAGAKSHFAIAIQDLSVPWYSSVGAMFRGLEKNLFGPGSHYQWWRMLWQVSSLWLLVAAPLVGLYLGVWRGAGFMLAAAISVIILQLVFSIYCVYEQRVETLRLLFFPLGMLLFSLMMLRAGYKCLKNGGIDWRGTHYPLDQLRAGQRVKF